MGKTIYLHCTLGGSDKVYNIYLENRPNGMGYVHAENGRRGSTLTPQIKTPNPVPYREAERIYDDLVNEKRRKKGYDVLREINTTEEAAPRLNVMTTSEMKKVMSDVAAKSSPQDIPQPKTPVLLPQLLCAIDETEVQRLINDDAWMMEEKKDGHRRLIIYQDGKAIGLNKKGEKVELTDTIINSLPKGTDLAIDGELIGDKYHAFDILMLGKKSLREVDAERRHDILSTVKFGKTINIVYVAKTTEEKQKLYESVKTGKKEGVVFKKKTSPYKSGRPNSGGDQLKYKLQNTASFIVSAASTGKRSVSLNLLDGDRIINLGKCSIPVNHDVPKTGEVVEVRYLYAFRDGSIFQAVYLGKRDDVTSDECVLSQLVYKSEEE